MSLEELEPFVDIGLDGIDEDYGLVIAVDFGTVGGVFGSGEVFRLLEDVDVGVACFVEEEGTLSVRGGTSRVIF